MTTTHDTTKVSAKDGYLAFVTALDEHGIEYGVRRSGQGWFRCPAHEDEHPSGSFSEGNEHPVVFSCKAGCSSEAILEALGLKWADVMRESSDQEEVHEKRRNPTIERKVHSVMGKTGATLERFLESEGITDDDVIRTAGLRLERSRLAVPWFDTMWNQVYESWRNIDGTLPKWLHKGERPPLYAASPTSWKANSVVVAEGELDALAIASAGLPALSVGGSSLSKDGARILNRKGCLFLFPDPDDGGEKFVAKIVEQVNRSTKVTIVPTPNGYRNIREFAAASDNPTEAIQWLMIRAHCPRLGPILDDIERTIRRHVVLPSDHEYVAVALWVAHTYFMEVFNVTPYLFVTSPEKGSGKTRLLEILELLVREPRRSSSMTPAVMYRMIRRDQPTILFDELDTIFGKRGGNEDLRGVIDGGYRRGNLVYRTNENTLEPDAFDTFCPKSLAGNDNGFLPDTIVDRSIPIRMKRKTDDEEIEELDDYDALRARYETEIRTRIATLTVEPGAPPTLPSSVPGRAREIWRPLLVVAEAAGGTWPKRAKRAAVALHDDQGAESEGIMLLRHVYEAFDGDRAIFTTKLVDKLVRRVDAPWAAWWGQELARAGNAKEKDAAYRSIASKVARKLKPFGIVSKTVRVGERTGKGYAWDESYDTFKRYLKVD